MANNKISMFKITKYNYYYTVLLINKNRHILKSTIYHFNFTNDIVLWKLCNILDITIDCSQYQFVVSTKIFGGP